MEPSKEAREVLKRATAVWEDNYAVNNATEAAAIIQQYGDARVAEVVAWLLSDDCRNDYEASGSEEHFSWWASDAVKARFLPAPAEHLTAGDE